MKIRVFLAVALLVTAAGQGRASSFTPAIDLGSGGTYFNFNLATGALDSGGTVGYTFTTGSSALMIDALGVYGGTGLMTTDPVFVYIYKPGAASALASATISSPADPLSTAVTYGLDHGQTYYYASISDLTLQANTTYDIGAFYTTGSQIFAASENPGSEIYSAPGITWVKGISGTGEYVTGDSIGIGSINSYFGPTFEIAAPATPSAVPEPASLAMLGMAVVTFGGYFGWRRRKQVVAA